MSFRYLDVHKTLAIINDFYHSAIKCIVCKMSFLDDFVRKKSEDECEIKLSMPTLNQI